MDEPLNASLLRAPLCGAENRAAASVVPLVVNIFLTGCGSSLSGGSSCSGCSGGSGCGGSSYKFGLVDVFDVCYIVHICDVPHVDFGLNVDFGCMSITACKAHF